MNYENINEERDNNPQYQEAVDEYFEEQRSERERNEEDNFNK